MSINGILTAGKILNTIIIIANVLKVAAVALAVVEGVKLCRSVIGKNGLKKIFS